MPSNPSQGAAAARRNTSTAGTRSEYRGSANAINGSVSARSTTSQQDWQGYLGGGYGARNEAPGGYQQPHARVNGYPQNAAVPYRDPNAFDHTGYGPSAEYVDALGRLDTLVPPQPPIRVPAEPHTPQPAANGGGRTPAAGTQQPQPQNQSASGSSQPAVNGQYNASGYTYRNTPQQPHPGYPQQPRSSYPQQYHPNSAYHSQQYPPNYPRRPGNGNGN